MSMYEARQDKEKVSRRIESDHSLQNNTRQIMCKSNIGYFISSMGKSIQCMKRKRAQKISPIDLNSLVNRQVSNSVTHNGQTYTFNFASGYQIYDASVLEVYHGTFPLMVHGQKKTYSTYLIVQGYRSAHSSSLATWKVYGYGNIITHLEERYS